MGYLSFTYAKRSLAIALHELIIVAVNLKKTDIIFLHEFYFFH
jgi:hypothetical protein